MEVKEHMEVQTLDHGQLLGVGPTAVSLCPAQHWLQGGV